MCVATSNKHWSSGISLVCHPYFLHIYLLSPCKQTTSPLVMVHWSNSSTNILNSEIKIIKMDSVSISSTLGVCLIKLTKPYFNMQSDNIWGTCSWLQMHLFMTGSSGSPSFPRWGLYNSLWTLKHSDLVKGACILNIE